MVSEGPMFLLVSRTSGPRDPSASPVRSSYSARLFSRNSPQASFLASCITQTNARRRRDSRGGAIIEPSRRGGCPPHLLERVCPANPARGGLFERRLAGTRHDSEAADTPVHYPRAVDTTGLSPSAECPRPVIPLPSVAGRTLNRSSAR